MEGSSFEHERLWHPFKALGIHHPFFTLQADTIINTWVALGVILAIALLTRWMLKKESLGAHVIKSVVKNFMQLVEQSTGTFVYRYYSFIASLFTFIIICNWVALFPTIEEPTKDLNTTLALGIIAFLYLQKEIIKVHGIRMYLKDYFTPVDIFFPLNLLIGLVMLPIKLLGELASIISLSFRLFGNIFGGAIIMSIFHQGIGNSVILNAIGTFFGINLLLTGFFILFEGFLQAFVFAILTLTNISMATAVEQGEHS